MINDAHAPVFPGGITQQRYALALSPGDGYAFPMRALNVFAIVAIFASTTPAHAAKFAQIELDTAEAKDGPGAENRTVFTVKKGEWVVSSNLPTNGFFKVRRVGGEIGWLPTEAVLHKSIRQKEERRPADRDSTADGEI